MTTLAPAPVLVVTPAREATLFSSVRPGSMVSIVSPQGQVRKGRCVMKLASHAVLNMGGPHGTPGIADDSNICAVSQPKARKAKA